MGSLCSFNYTNNSELSFTKRNEEKEKFEQIKRRTNDILREAFHIKYKMEYDTNLETIYTENKKKFDLCKISQEDSKDVLLNIQISREYARQIRSHDIGKLL